jgi:hypothetical protein
MKELLEKIITTSVNSIKDELTNYLQKVEYPEAKQLTQEKEKQEKIDEIFDELEDEDSIIPERLDPIRPSAPQRIERAVRTERTERTEIPESIERSENPKSRPGDFVTPQITRTTTSTSDKSDPPFVTMEHLRDSGVNLTMINAYNRNRRLNIMVIGAAVGLLFCLLALASYKGDLPGEVVGIISTVAGIFGACLKDAYSFEFGSSRGSKDKDDKISATILERLHK